MVHSGAKQIILGIILNSGFFRKKMASNYEKRAARFVAKYLPVLEWADSAPTWYEWADSAQTWYHHAWPGPHAFKQRNRPVMGLG